MLITILFVFGGMEIADILLVPETVDDLKLEKNVNVVVTFHKMLECTPQNL